MEKPKKVLILLNDSDPLLSRVCKNKFEKEDGWEATLSTDFDKTLEDISKIKPDLLITEIIIKDSSGRTGFDLIEQIRSKKNFDETKIVVFSDLSQDSDKDKAKELGANYYYVKSETTIFGIIEEIKKII